MLQSKRRSEILKSVSTLCHTWTELCCSLVVPLNGDCISAAPPQMLSFMYAHLTFFHQGYDLFSELQPLMKLLGGQVHNALHTLYYLYIYISLCILWPCDLNSPKALSLDATELICFPLPLINCDLISENKHWSCAEWDLLCYEKRQCKLLQFKQTVYFGRRHSVHMPLHCPG